MSAVNGKWKLVSSENFMEYCKAIGTSGPSLEQAKVLEDTGDNGLVEEYNFDGTTVVRKLSAAGGKISKEQSIAIGAEVAATSLDGKPIKTKLTVDGNIFTRVEKGDGYESTWIRTVSGDDMTVDISVGDVKCLRKYKKI